jgi:hypothetical protein
MSFCDLYVSCQIHMRLVLSVRNTFYYIFFSFHGWTDLVGLALLYETARSLSDTPHSVRLLWTSDRHIAETSTWQHTTLATDIYALGGIRTRKSSKRAAADSRLRPRGPWDGLFTTIFTKNTSTLSSICYLLFVSTNANTHTHTHIYIYIYIYIYYNNKLYYKRSYMFQLFCTIFRDIWCCIC